MVSNEPSYSYQSADLQNFATSLDLSLYIICFAYSPYHKTVVLPNHQGKLTVKADLIFEEFSKTPDLSPNSYVYMPHCHSSGPAFFTCYTLLEFPISR